MLEQYREKLSQINKSVNAIYNRLTFSTVAEVLEEEIDLRGLWNRLHEMYNKAHQHHEDIQKWLYRIPDEESHDLDMEIDDIYRVTIDKIDAAQDLIDSLENITIKDDEYGIRDKFKDIQSLDI